MTAADAARDPHLEPGDYAELTVMDTGSGMPKEVADRAFDPFFTTKEPGRGSGLGLSMVYGFAKQSKGHIAIKSRVGHGTTVSLLLPRAAPQARPAEIATADQLAASGNGQRILVVEDNAKMRKTAVAQLTALGYWAAEADSAAKAMVILKDEADINLVFSDIIMPGAMNGLELAAAARRLRPGIKILLTSGYNDTVDADAKNGELLLSKPYRQDDLARMLSKILQQGRDKAA